jgi:thymidine kinase
VNYSFPFCAFFFAPWTEQTTTKEMPKLYFRYGTMSSAKTLNLLAVAHNYTAQGKRVLLLKPEIDTRHPDIHSRAGLTRPADIIVKGVSDLVSASVHPELYDCVLVDEVQFFDPECIDVFHDWAIHHCPVICYGLRTDCFTKLFDASRRLFELAETIEEIKTTCQHCNKKAIFNRRLPSASAPAVSSSSSSMTHIEIGGDEKYEAVCAVHF